MISCFGVLCSFAIAVYTQYHSIRSSTLYNVYIVYTYDSLAVIRAACVHFSAFLTTILQNVRSLFTNSPCALFLSLSLFISSYVRHSTYFTYLFLIFSLLYYFSWCFVVAVFFSIDISLTKPFNTIIASYKSLRCHFHIS